MRKPQPHTTSTSWQQEEGTSSQKGNDGSPESQQVESSNYFD